MKKLLCMIIATAALFLVNTATESAGNRINVGVVSSDAAVYGEMVSLLTRSEYLQVIERRDLGSLFKELELKQSGAVLGPSDSRLKGIEYLIMIDTFEHKHSARIVKAETGEIVVSWTGFISELAQNCIDKLESEASLKNIALMQNDEGIEIDINFSKDYYTTGSRIEFTVVSSSDGYLYIIDVQPDGNVIVLVPNQNTKGPIAVEEGEPVEIPGRLGFKMKAGQPYGIDTIKVIVTKKKIDIFRFGLNAGKDYTEVTGKDRDKLSRGISVELENLPASDWGIASKQIEIKE
ncbi:MAG TPA: DUF4384 domain-containing protein [Spirochaetota bacterium]|nr:DUF4384 domain-containing protein [Spirochaetota bacterium]